MSDLNDGKNKLHDFDEVRYKNLIESAPDAFFHGDLAGSFILVNSKAAELTGYPKDELLKMNMRELFDNNSLKEKPLRYDLLKSGQNVTTERKMIKKDGSSIDVEMNSCALPDGSYESFIRDITERKKSEIDYQT